MLKKINVVFKKITLPGYRAENARDEHPNPPSEMIVLKKSQFFNLKNSKQESLRRIIFFQKSGF